MYSYIPLILYCYFRLIQEVSGYTTVKECQSSHCVNLWRSVYQLGSQCNAFIHLTSDNHTVMIVAGSRNSIPVSFCPVIHLVFWISLINLNCFCNLPKHSIIPECSSHKHAKLFLCSSMTQQAMPQKGIVASVFGLHFFHNAIL